MSSTLKPVLKWVGGKTQLLVHLEPLVPRRLASYHECFLGGAALLLLVLSKLDDGTLELLPSGRIVASDINSDLIDFYLTVRDAAEPLIVKAEELASAYNSNTKASVRGKDDSVFVPPSLAASTLAGQDAVYYFLRSEYNQVKKRPFTELSGAERVYKSAAADAAQPHLLQGPVPREQERRHECGPTAATPRRPST